MRLPRLIPVCLAALMALVAACGGSPAGDVAVGGNPPSSDGATPADGAQAAGPAVDVLPGMPAVVDPRNLYSEAGADDVSGAIKDVPFRVYVPHEVSGTVSVIDPITMKVLDTFTTGVIPQHVVPSYDLSMLYVLNNTSNTITPLDPKTGKPGKNIAVDDPYNLYFTPDGKQAIIVAEAYKRLDFADPKTFAVTDSLQTDCDGINHLDYSIDGRYFIATCEFDGRLIKVDLTTKKVVGTMKLDISVAGKKKTAKPMAQPQDVRVSPDGKTFYVADLITDGVYTLDGESFRQTGFVPAGVGTHGLYPSRDGTKLYITNRGTNTLPPPGTFKGKGKGSVSVMDFATNAIVATWEIPNGGSPDMGNITADGRQFWVSGRYDAEVYVFDTTTGTLATRIPVGKNPHGLTVWPQPGRYSLGHTGNMR